MPDERSSASAMTGEKAAREKAMSISLQTWPSAAWITASVMGSMALMASPPTTMRKLPIASTVAVAPGSITVVASICWTMAGPVRRAASGSFTRSNTCAVCQRPSANNWRSPITASCTLAERPAGSSSEAMGNAGRRPITEVTRLTSTALISGSRTWKRAS